MKLQKQKKSTHPQQDRISSTIQEGPNQFIFERKNYKFMLIGIAFIALGFILMAGGGSDDPNIFNPEIYNWRRIRLAPALVLIGFAIEVYAILLNPYYKEQN